MKFKLSPLFLLLFGFLLVFSSCQKDSDDPQLELDDELTTVLSQASNGQGLDFFILPNSDDYESIPQDPRNPITDAKVTLGKFLYHETGIGLAPMQEVGSQSYSCASCHFASAGFQAGRFQGLGEGGIGFGMNGEGRHLSADYDETNVDAQPVRSPSILNIAFQEAVLWNGQFGALGINAGTEYAWTEDTPIENNELGYEGTEIQAIAGLTVHRMVCTPEVVEQSGYKSYFDEAFPGLPEEQRYDLERAGLAIAAYERTVLSTDAPFQKWLKGDKNAMTTAEKAGAILFFGKANCVSCHGGPNLANMEFHALGMNDFDDIPETTFQAGPGTPAFLGRASFTGDQDDMYKFKVPQLYNLSDSPFYGHGSSFRSIRDVIEYKNEAVAENPDVPESMLSPMFTPLGLTEQEIDDLTAFLYSGLRDPNLTRFEPDVLPTGNCFPNGDELSMQDLGCN